MKLENKRDAERRTMGGLVWFVALAIAFWGSSASAQQDVRAAPNSADEMAAMIQQIAAQLKNAQLQLANRDTSSETQQLQRQSLQQLKSLVKQLEVQSSTAPTAASGANNATSQTPSAPNQSPVTNPNAASNPSSPAAGQRIWGHLRKRLRDRMQAAGVEEFLPEYEGMLEAYYRKLGR